MPKRNVTEDLYDPRGGGQAIRIERVRSEDKPFEPARTNFFSVYLIESGSGTFWADASQFSFDPGALLFFVPYQHIRFAPDVPVHGEVVLFHANFLCVETFHAEVGCSGLLFNDPYGIPVVAVDERARADVKNLIAHMRTENEERDLAYSEAMLAHLKVLLILATRLKSPKAGVCGPGMDLRHPVLVQLRDLIEQNYRSLHSPADYAERLHLTPKTLGRIVREHLGTTPTDLIRNRILIHAKWQLLHTLKPVKEVAREVGFGDELYFSRLFKKATGYSPTFFREFETEIRGGSNLSMSSGHAPFCVPPEPPILEAGRRENKRPAAGGSNGDAEMGVQKLFELASRMDKVGVTLTRVGLIVVLLWIGGLKAFRYEADGIVPFVANSPAMSFFYADPDNYKAHKNPEGVLNAENRAWHEANHTYEFAYGLGAVIVLYGLLLCVHPWLPQVAAVGSFLVFVMSFVTLSFLVTTPECWVPPLGDAQHGFPYLSGAGRLVVKDIIMMGAAVVTMADSAKAYLRKRAVSVAPSRVAVKQERLLVAGVR